jgi:hypothetical protein
MTVRVNKQPFNLREKLTELERPIGLKGYELMKSETAQEARDLVSAGRKNKIINGAMLIDQRHGGNSHTNSNGYHTDRFRSQVSGMDQLVQTYQQVSDGPPGFPKSLKVTTTTPESSFESGEYIAVYQKIPGRELQDFAYGTSSAKPVTISFYVKSSITGTFGYTVYRNDNQDRAINKSYTIISANTWEKKSITLEGDTEDPISNLNTDQWWNVWHLGAASGYASSPNSNWKNYTGQNWAGFHEGNRLVTTQNATWQITGVQLEVGSNATEFEHRSSAEELALCERYYEVIWQNNNSSSPHSGGDGYNTIAAGAYTGSHGYYVWNYRTQKRVRPTINYSGKFRVLGGASVNNILPNEFYSPGLDAARIRVPHSGSNGQAFVLEFDGGNSSNGYISASAEL